MGTIGQHSLDIWFRNLKRQIEIIDEKRKTEPLERAYSLEIALAYLFLYLSTESILDYLVFNISMHNSPMGNIYRKYKSARYLRDKLEFIFFNFCPNLPFAEYDALKQRLKKISKIRNWVVHLEELSWRVTLIEGKPPIERPNKYAAELTVKRFKENYNSATRFFDELKTILDKGFNHKEIKVEYREDGQIKIRRENFINYIYTNSVSRFPLFE